MDRIDRYVEQVCRTIGGPRALRQHVRQELREHLLDAVAGHRAAGLSEEEAVARALEEFGRPEELRSELEAAHGQRALAVVVEKALQWKERTMKAKWLWASWAYLSLAVVVALEVLFLTFNVIYIVPRFQKLLHDGIIDAAHLDEQGVAWMPAYLQSLQKIGGGGATWWLLGSIAGWGLFEWLVRGENKPLMRAGVLGTAAAALMVLVGLTAAALLIPFCLGAPATGQLARQFAAAEVSRIDAAVATLEQSQGTTDWAAMGDNADRAAQALDALTKSPMVIPALAHRNEPATVQEMRDTIRAARDELAAVRQAIHDKDAAKLRAALERFRKAYAPLRDVARRAAA